MCIFVFSNADFVFHANTLWRGRRLSPQHGLRRAAVIGQVAAPDDRERLHVVSSDAAGPISRSTITITIT